MKPTDESAQADAKQRPAPEPTQVGIGNLRAPRQQTMLAPPAAGSDSTWVAGVPRARDDSAEAAATLESAEHSWLQDMLDADEDLDELEKALIAFIDAETEETFVPRPAAAA